MEEADPTLWNYPHEQTLFSCPRNRCTCNYFWRLTGLSLWRVFFNKTALSICHWESFVSFPEHRFALCFHLWTSVKPLRISPQARMLLLDLLFHLLWRKRAVFSRCGPTRGIKKIVSVGRRPHRWPRPEDELSCGDTTHTERCSFCGESIFPLITFIIQLFLKYLGGYVKTQISHIPVERKVFLKMEVQEYASIHQFQILKCIFKITS